jgi:hypothetical protein
VGDETEFLVDAINPSGLLTVVPVLLIVAPLSQVQEPPAMPGRFTGSIPAGLTSG